MVNVKQELIEIMNLGDVAQVHDKIKALEYRLPRSLKDFYVVRTRLISALKEDDLPLIYTQLGSILELFIQEGKNAA